MQKSFDIDGDIVWRPTPDYIESSHLHAFMEIHGISNFQELHARSINDVAWFTDAVIKYLDIQFYKPYSEVVELSNGIAWPKWCVNGEMNIIHNCLDKYIGTATEDQNAFVWEGENGETQAATYKELFHKVNQTANALRELGLGKGDSIGIYMPMTPEIVITLLAIAKIGGIILPLFSGYGIDAIATRLLEADAIAIFTADGFSRRDKIIPMKPTVDLAVAKVPTIQHIIVHDHVGLATNMRPGRDHWWDQLVSSQDINSPTEVTSAEDMLMIIYTSGTTGRPKGAVHTHCGFPIKAAQDMAFGTDVHPGQTIYWMTDMGWMMGPWLVFGTLLLGATFFIYDGAPDYPNPSRLWNMVEDHSITTLGVSPTLIRSLLQHGDEHHKKHDISSLRFFASTGEPWNPDPWMWLFKNVGGSKIPIINYSGGTEISGGIVMGNPLSPLKPAAFSAPCPGIAADIFDENGKSVLNQVGELVILAPWIGMTRGFWKDPQRYEETYWSRWPETWVHGDLASKDSDGLWYIFGRSDDTIKIAGKRLGPAEVESILVAHSDVLEAAAIGIPHEIKGNELIVFCVTVPLVGPTEELRANLHNKVVSAMGKPLAPKKILFVNDLPKTRNAKVMRRIVRAAYLQLDPGDISSLVNPEAMQEIRRAS